MTTVERRNVEHKGLATFEIKDAEKGEVEAVFATLNVVDHDEDVIVDDAIQDGQKAKLSCYGHDAITADEAPVGIGRVRVEGNKAIFSGRYFLTTTRGREAFQTVKEMGADQEWSFGFRVLGDEVPSEAWKKKGARRIITKLDVFEVSPVLEGAGIGTRTTAVKSATTTDHSDSTLRLAELAAKGIIAEQSEEEAATRAAAEAKIIADAKEAERVAAEQAAETARKEAERVAAELKAAEQQRQISEEFARFQRTRRRLGAA